MTSPVTDSLQRQGCAADSVQIIEAWGGSARQQWLRERVSVVAEGTTRTFVVGCDFDLEGPWAGLKDLISALLPGIQSLRPELIDLHGRELTSALPHLRKSLVMRHPTLTDIASEQEKVRSYAADRAFRNAHGLIDLISDWKMETDPNGRWIIACDDYDNAGAMTRFFFQHLIRRRGLPLKLTLLIAVDPGHGDSIVKTFETAHVSRVETLDLPESEPLADEQESVAAAAELEKSIGQDRIEKEAHLHTLTNLWKAARRYDKVIELKLFAVTIYLHAGLYADALRCSEGLLEMATECAPEDEKLRRDIVIKRLNALMGAQDPEAALKLVETEVLVLAERAPLPWRVDLFYLAAMVYARYLKPRNFAKGEEFLDRALEALKQAGLPEDQYQFQYVFNRNGVAMIRSFQQRAQDAIDLCQNGIDRLNTYVAAEKHKLHRSVLVYNIAQVYLAIGRYEEAIEHYSDALAIDPNYSEYYNERGGIFMRMNRLDEARADYLKAIVLSPPYFEVFTNLGQCYRNMENYEDAANAYSRALDLEPNQLLALLGRAQAYENLSNRRAAIADYTSALACDAGQWEALANRGVLYYEEGDLQRALSDFDAAIRLEQNQISLYQNRSIVLAGLGRHDKAARDLETVLSLDPPDEERPLIQEQLKTRLEAASPEASRRTA
jgi:tetratricopeptide (TPR) repeat protein